MEYLPTKLGHKYGVNVGKYSSTMDPSWDLVVPVPCRCVRNFLPSIADSPSVAHGHLVFPDVGAHNPKSRAQMVSGMWGDGFKLTNHIYIYTIHMYLYLCIYIYMYREHILVFVGLLTSFDFISFMTAVVLGSLPVPPHQILRARQVSHTSGAESHSAWNPYRMVPPL